MLLYTNRGVHLKTKKAETLPQGFLVGYARVSTEDQSLELQLEALRKAGVLKDNLHVEKLSATAKNRPALDNAIKDLREGDTLLVWRLDRFARSMRDLYARLDRVYAKGAKFRSITEAFDFDTFTGKFVLGILGLVAELERQIIAHRTKAGIEALRASGDGKWGREALLSEANVKEAGRLLKSGWTGPKVAAKFKVSTPTVYQHWKLNRTGRGPKWLRKTKPK
jgi:DNA invertase Pin-like site-specific DNA recombinase